MDTLINTPSFEPELPVETLEFVNDLTGHQDDAVVAVMGVTGSGKSSFIKLVTGDNSVKIGNNLDSETSDIQILHFRDPDSGRKVTFVDTPGFDDSRSSDDSHGSDESCPKFTDTDILKRIADFLLQEYDQNRKLSGLIYVQRISDPRFSGQSSRNLRMFRELCGPAAYKNIVVLTTYWDQLPTQEVGVEREAQLMSKHFAKLVEGGAQFMRHDRTVEGTCKVLRHFLPMSPIITQIQTEIRIEGKSITETAAGSVHSKEVEEAIAKYKKDITDLTAEMATLKESNKAARQELETELAELRDSLAGQEREQAELKKGLDEERDLRKRLEKEAGELRTQFQEQIQSESLSEEEEAEKLQNFQDAVKEAVDRALRQGRKQSFSRRMMDIAEDVPLVPSFIGKPVLGAIGLCFDAIRAIVR